MSWLNLESIPYHERLIFVWIASGEHGELEAAFVIDGRDYSDSDEARAAAREALELTDQRAKVGEYRSVRIPENVKELDYWTGWAEFREFLDVYGPVYPWRRRAAPKVPTLWSAPKSTPKPTATVEALTPLYDERHFECWGELIETYPRGQQPYDPVVGREAEAYGLNGYTGEFEANTRRGLQCAHGFDDDDTWPMRDEEEFITTVENRREKRMRNSFFQRQDKPEIFAAYEQAEREGRTAQSRRATYEMWWQAQRRRAYFFVETEPVRVDLSDDGAATMAWRLDTATGRIVPTDRTDAQAVLGGANKRVTEHVWLLAIEDRRRMLPVDGDIAEAYAKAAAVPDDKMPYRRRILTRSFDLWAEKFADVDAGGTGT